jgi:Cu-Zn family superoxide dismutase
MSAAQPTGAIYGAAPGAGRFEPFLPPSLHGRTAATGLKVDGRGRLFVAGLDTGRAWVYDLRMRRLVRALRAGGRGRRPFGQTSI